MPATPPSSPAATAGAALASALDAAYAIGDSAASCGSDWYLSDGNHTPPTLADGYLQTVIPKGSPLLAATGRTMAGGKLYQVQRAPSWQVTVLAFDETNKRFMLERTIPLAFRNGTAPQVQGNESNGIAVDPQGNLYVSFYLESGVRRFSSTGVEQWVSADVVHPHTVFGYSTAQGYRIAASMRNADGAYSSYRILDTDGHTLGLAPFSGSLLNQTADGRLLALDQNTRYIRIYDTSGNLLRAVGSPAGPNDGAPVHFYLPGGAVLRDDGRLYITDARKGIVKARPEGFIEGVAADGYLGGLPQSSEIYAPGDGYVYFLFGDMFGAIGMNRISFADLDKAMVAPYHPAQYAGMPAWSFGYGAGLMTKAAANHFPAGKIAAVYASFQPSWQLAAADLAVRYVTCSRDQAVANAAVEWKPLSIPASGDATALPLAVPTGTPGSYEVRAELYWKGQRLGKDQLYYSVGAPDHKLDFETLPAGADSGGPRPNRALALAGQLGITDIRIGFDWSVIMPDPSGPLDFRAYDAEIDAAAARAAASGVALHAQLGAHVDGREGTLLRNGAWQARVTELVAHYRDRIKVWEAWNEPNTGHCGCTPQYYVDNVLKPFYRGVKVADPAAQVIGGSLTGLALGWWDAIGAAGAFNYMDIVGWHPYANHNRSWEENGSDTHFQVLKTQILPKYGAASKPIWLTELGWWTGGAYNHYAQGETIARALAWFKSYGIDRWYYFIPEGGFGGDNPWSIIQTDGASFVRPAALAYQTFTAQVGRRPFQAMVPTDAPQTWAMRFGGTGAADGQRVLMIWTDGMRSAARLGVAAAGAGAPGSVAITVTRSYGASTTHTVPAGGAIDVAIDGAPIYVSYPSSVVVTPQSHEAYGANAAIGGTASATSEAAGNPASLAIDQRNDAAYGAELAGISAWGSANGDRSRTLTVRFAAQKAIDRVLVSTNSSASVVPAVRDYDIELETAPGAWSVVARRRGMFYQRQAIERFAATKATAMRIKVLAVNFGGMVGGTYPGYWPDAAWCSANKGNGFMGTVCDGSAIVYELQAYAPPS